MRTGTLWLVGMMGAGKSAVGAALARRLGTECIDTDREVEAAAGRSVAAIFAEDGEEAFRRLERQAIERVEGKPVVVALGGGAMAQPGVPARLAATGSVAYLRARPETLLARIGAGARRPLLAGLDAGAREERLRALLADREPVYAQAALVVDTDDLSAEAVAARIAARLDERAEEGRTR